MVQEVIEIISGLDNTLRRHAKGLALGIQKMLREGIDFVPGSDSGPKKLEKTPYLLPAQVSDHEWDYCEILVKGEDRAYPIEERGMDYS